MPKLVVNIAQEFRSKPVVAILIFIVWLALAAVAVRLGIEDYLTSVYGYQLIPTRKTDPNLAYFVSALPTLIQIAFGAWAIEKRSRLATVVTLIAFVVDVVTDVNYKVSGVSAPSAWLYPLAVAETVVLFTLGSEFLLIAAAQNVFEYLPDAVVAFFVILSKLGEVFSKMANWLFGNDEDRHGAQMALPIGKGR